ncbi:MAG: 2-amino-4-hydroxy-6-hydroxymethyldihydropteridine diphosphokinase [Anaerolineaceae bacterium]|nr:2-amino-4-hydroxy-6-hydroxymethyldihydropteridine diphosphokinase [Anaerolineaceae bacterium]
MNKAETVFIALGSNLGDREGYLQAGREALNQVLVIEQVSAIYETPPWGVLDQPKYLNQVVQGTTNTSPLDLLKFLKDSEAAAGRTTGVRYGPRVLDMDILFYGQQIMELDSLQIPHPRIAERAFVLVPLNEIAPQWQHPISGMTISEMLAASPMEEIIRYE